MGTVNIIANIVRNIVIFLTEYEKPHLYPINTSETMLGPYL